MQEGHLATTWLLFMRQGLWPYVNVKMQILLTTYLEQTDL